MNKRIRLLQISIMSFIGLSFSKAETAFTYHKFIKQLEAYRLNAPWITDTLMELPLADFCHGFCDVMQMLAHEDQRWNYFSERPEDFVAQDYLVQFLWQSGYYDRWLKQVNVDRGSGSLEYKQYYKTGNILPGYIKSLKSGDTIQAYYAFYASVFDCLTHFMWQLMCALADPVERTEEHRKAAVYCYKKMEEYVEHNLKISSYYAEYKLALKKWHEIYQDARIGN